MQRGQVTSNSSSSDQPALVKFADECGLVKWAVQCMDTSFAKSSKANEATGRNPTDRGKGGVKKSVLTDAKGYPLSVVLAGANRHDSKLAKATLDAIIIPRPVIIQLLCLDKGYSGKPCKRMVEEAGYLGNIKQIGEEKRTSHHTPIRWVVERTHAWFNNFRGLRIRYEKKAQNHQGMLEFAAALMWWRRLERATRPHTTHLQTPSAPPG